MVFDLADDAGRILRDGGESYAGEAPLDFHDPNVVVMAGALPALLKPNSRAWIRASADGGRTWRKPILLPLCGLANVTGHGPPTVRQDGMCLLGLSTTSADGWTNRPLVYASPDGIDWHFLSFVTPAIDGGSAVSDRAGPIIFGAIRHFYTRLLALRDGRILASVRFQRDATGVMWTDIFESEDGARTWRFLSRVNDWGAPGDIVEMQRRPHRLRLRVSARAARHSRARQRRRRPHLGSRADPARRRRQLGPGLSARHRSRRRDAAEPSTT